MAYAMENDQYRSKRSYIATAAFNTSIWQYTTQLNGTNFKNEGKLTRITTLPSGTAVSTSNCPAGRILREVGRKLYPGNHPGLKVGETYSGAVVGTTETDHFWVLVYDNVTGLRGYIDPNGSIFAVYNSDKALELSDTAELQGGTPLARLGSSVYTAGTVTAGAGVTTTGGAIIQYRTVTALGTSGAATLTAAQTVGAIVTQAATGSQALTLPATTALITALGSTVGATCEFIYSNSAAQTVTVTAADGNTTIVGTQTVNNTLARFTILVASSTTVIVYRA